jgi:hypothetical protein
MKREEPELSGSFRVERKTTEMQETSEKSKKRKS